MVVRKRRLRFTSRVLAITESLPRLSLQSVCNMLLHLINLTPHDCIELSFEFLQELMGVFLQDQVLNQPKLLLSKHDLHRVDQFISDGLLTEDLLKLEEVALHF